MGEPAEARGIEYNAYPVAMEFIEFMGEAAYIQGPFGSGKTVAAIWKKYLLGIEAFDLYGLDAKPFQRLFVLTERPLQSKNADLHYVFDLRGVSHRCHGPIRP